MLKIKNNILFVGLGSTFQIWDLKISRNLKLFKEKKRIKIDHHSNGIIKEDKSMSINIGGGELKIKT